MGRNLLDLEVIASLRELGGEDTSFFQEMISLYLRETKKKLETANELLGQGKLTEMGKIFHQLKSSSGNVGAVGLFELGTEIEEAAAAGKSGLDKPLAEFRRLFAEVETELTRLLASRAA